MLRNFFLGAAIVAVSTMMYLQVGMSTASAGRGCKMGGNCNYNAQGHSQKGKFKSK